MAAMPSRNDFDKGTEKFFLENARKSIEKAFRNGIKLPEPSTQNQKKLSMEKAGCFVTLTINKDLRGCIGTIEPVHPLLDGVRRNAVQSAFHDPRFLPLDELELEEIKIEISVLSKPVALKETGQKAFELIKEGIHGVILDFGFTSSTFLPSVWNELPDKKEFLEHLSLKAGMDKDDWKNAKVSLYTSYAFEE